MFFTDLKTVHTGEKKDMKELIYLKQYFALQKCKQSLHYFVQKILFWISYTKIH